MDRRDLHQVYFCVLLVKPQKMKKDQLKNIPAYLFAERGFTEIIRSGVLKKSIDRRIVAYEDSDNDREQSFRQKARAVQKSEKTLCSPAFRKKLLLKNSFVIFRLITMSSGRTCIMYMMS